MKTVFNENPSVNIELQLFQERWCHQDTNHLKKIEEELRIKVKHDNGISEPCIYGKVYRSLFGTRNTVSKSGELISLDVCGPFYLSFSNNLYLVAFENNYTEYH